MPQPTRTWRRISVHICLVWCSLASLHLLTNLTFSQSQKWRKVWISPINPRNRTRSKFKLAAKQVALRQVSTYPISVMTVFINLLPINTHRRRLGHLHEPNDPFFLSKFQKSVAIHQAMKAKRPLLNAFLWMTGWKRRESVHSAGSEPNSPQNKSRNSRRSSANTNIWTLGRELKLPLS